MARMTLTAIGSEKLELGFSVSLPERVKEELRSATAQIADRMEGEVRSNLTGGVLKSRTGRLSGAVVARRFEANGFIGAKVGVTNDGYVGRFYEKGYDGRMDVRASARRSFKGGNFPVRSYTRTVTNSHRPWLMPVLDANRASIRTELQAAVDRAMPEEM